MRFEILWTSFPVSCLLGRADAAYEALFSHLETGTWRPWAGEAVERVSKGKGGRKGGSLELRWWEGFLEEVVELSLKALSLGRYSGLEPRFSFFFYKV